MSKQDAPIDDTKNPSFDDFKKMRDKNEQLLYTLLQQIQPDWYVLADLIEKNNLNSYIIFKFIRQLLNIVQGTGWGKITIVIHNGKVMTMESAEMDSVEEKITRLDADVYQEPKTRP